MIFFCSFATPSASYQPFIIAPSSNFSFFSTGLEEVRMMTKTCSFIGGLGKNGDRCVLCKEEGEDRTKKRVLFFILRLVCYQFIDGKC